MLKKIACVVIFVFYTILQPIGGASCSAQSSQDFQQQCIGKGKAFLEEYYNSINTQTTTDLPKYDIETDIAEYLDCKRKIMVDRLERSNCNVTYSDVNVECDDYESSNDEVTVIYNVLVQRKYEGSDEIAESMRQVRLNFKDDNATAEIADCFEYSEFDMNVFKKQNEDVTLVSIEDNNLYEHYHINYGKEANNILNEMKEQEKKFYDKCDKTSNNYKKKLLKSSNNTLSSLSNKNEVTLLSISSSARSKIVTYAKNNCSKITPSSGNSIYASYYDFNQLSGAYDCTNFASHCMLAGGAKENSSLWYYNSFSDRTASWSGVNQFYNFIISNSGNGPQAEERSLAYGCPLSYINWSNGDIIQLQYPDYGYPGFGHTTIITGSYSANSYSNTPRVTSRTGANWYTKNEVLTVQYPISDNILAYRLLHLTDI